MMLKKPQNVPKVFLFMLFGLLMSAANLVIADMYMELEPGVSSKRDADKVLGSPIEEIVRLSLIHI